MTKPPLYLIKTDYNIDPFTATTTLDPKELAEAGISPEHYNLFTHPYSAIQTRRAIDLSRLLQEHYSKDLTPCIELTPGIINTHLNFSRFFTTSFPPEESYETLQALIHLKHPSIDNAFARARLPQDFVYFDLFFDFVSNECCYDKTFQRLRNDFQIEQLEILTGKETKRTRWI